jgi:hypothetical protein
MQSNQLGWRVATFGVVILFLLALIYAFVQLIQALGVSS